MSIFRNKPNICWCNQHQQTLMAAINAWEASETFRSSPEDAAQSEIPWCLWCSACIYSSRWFFFEPVLSPSFAYACAASSHTYWLVVWNENAKYMHLITYGNSCILDSFWWKRCSFEGCDSPSAHNLSPRRHTHPHTDTLCSVSPGLVAPVVALEHVLRPLLDHVSGGRGGGGVCVLGGVGIGSFEGTEEIGGEFTSKAGEFLSDTHVHTHTLSCS